MGMRLKKVTRKVKKIAKVIPIVAMTPLAPIAAPLTPILKASEPIDTGAKIAKTIRKTKRRMVAKSIPQEEQYVSDIKPATHITYKAPALEEKQIGINQPNMKLIIGGIGVLGVVLLVMSGNIKKKKQ